MPLVAPYVSAAFRPFSAVSGQGWTVPPRPRGAHATVFGAAARYHFKEDNSP